MIRVYETDKGIILTDNKNRIINPHCSFETISHINVPGIHTSEVLNPGTTAYITYYRFSEFGFLEDLIATKITGFSEITPSLYEQLKEPLKEQTNKTRELTYQRSDNGLY